MIRLIASDLDGTLLNEKGALSGKTIEIINASQQEGIRWIVSTGRTLRTVSDIMKPARVSCDYLLLNGAEFRKSNGELIFQTSIKKQQAVKLIQYLQRMEIDFEINTSIGDFSTDCRFCNTARPMLPEMELLKSELEIQKIFVFEKNRKCLEEKKKNLQEVAGITITSSADWNIEITDSQSTKGIMLEAIADYYGLSKDEILVFGDGENDLSMFSRFPHSRAMGNAVKSLKEIAEKVIETNIENGVAQEVCRVMQKNKY